MLLAQECEQILKKSNLRKKWGFRRFQKERLKVHKTALF